MNREWVGRMAARAYPAEVHAERGGELVGTLLDAGEDSGASFVCQVGSVLRAGLAARARDALTRPLTQIATCALAWVAVMTIVRSLVSLVAFDIRATGHVGFPDGTFVTWILPACVVASFTLKLTRVSGIFGVALIALRLAENATPTSFRLLVELVLPVAGFVAMAIAPRQVPSSGRWVWLVPTTVLVFLEVMGIGLYSGVFLIVPLAVALCFLPFQPSFALGTALAWTLPIAINLFTISGGAGRVTAFTIVVVSCVPFAVMVASFGRVRARRE
jgi:hypothetical protein